MSLTYLDSVIVIYAVEITSHFQARAQTHVANLRVAGTRMAASDLTWLECRIRPLRAGDAALLADFDKFLTAPDITRFPLPAHVFERAALIRAVHNYKLGDALHLAVAVERGCDVFLTNDKRLSGFPDLTVEILP